MSTPGLKPEATGKELKGAATLNVGCSTGKVYIPEATGKELKGTT
jgi:hypothetical protein